MPNAVPPINEPVRYATTAPGLIFDVCLLSPYTMGRMVPTIEKPQGDHNVETPTSTAANETATVHTLGNARILRKTMNANMNVAVSHKSCLVWDETEKSIFSSSSRSGILNSFMAYKRILEI